MKCVQEVTEASEDPLDVGEGKVLTDGEVEDQDDAEDEADGVDGEVFADAVDGFAA